MKIHDKLIPGLALVVSIISLTVSLSQWRTADAQLRLAGLQQRPYVTFTPTFFRDKTGLKIDMYLQAVTPIPARVLYTDVAVWNEDEFLKPNFISTRDDIIYQDKGALSSLPEIEGKFLKKVDAGDEFIRTATCVVYTSLSKSDTRRWRVQAIQKYVPGQAIPTRYTIEEDEVGPDVAKCDAKAYYERFNVAVDGAPVRVDGANSKRTSK